jgi:hypothetical protein
VIRQNGIVIAAEIDQEIEAILGQHRVALAGSKRLASVLRFWISCWVIAALEIAVAEQTSEQAWLDRAEALRDLGYRVALDPPEDLVRDLSLMRSTRVTSETRITKAAAVVLTEEACVASPVRARKPVSSSGSSATAKEKMGSSAARPNPRSTACSRNICYVNK